MPQDSPIYIFNPDTEIALASGLDSFTPRKNVLDFERKLSLLPALYAEEGSDIWLPYCDTREETAALPYHDVATARGIRLIPKYEIRGCTSRIIPWGWNRALAHMLRSAGYAGSHIPSPSAMEVMRTLASRHTAVEVWLALSASPGFAEISVPEMCPRCFETEKEAADFAATCAEGCVVKSPWSSSGRGVYFSSGKSPAMTVRRIAETLKAQGEVIIEPLWRKSLDFATEWRAREGDVEFLGFSLFATDEAGHYAGNYVAPQSSLLARIIRHIDEKALWLSIEAMRPRLRDAIAGGYSGPFGVDMLVDDSGHINPCVEINLRHTMGHVAISLHQLTGGEFLFIPGRELPITHFR